MKDFQWASELIEGHQELLQSQRFPRYEKGKELEVIQTLNKYLSEIERDRSIIEKIQDKPKEYIQLPRDAQEQLLESLDMLKSLLEPENALENGLYKAKLPEPFPHVQADISRLELLLDACFQ